MKLTKKSIFNILDNRKKLCSEAIEDDGFVPIFLEMKEL